MKKKIFIMIAILTMMVGIIEINAETLTGTSIGNCEYLPYYYKSNNSVNVNMNQAVRTWLNYSFPNKKIDVYPDGTEGIDGVYPKSTGTYDWGGLHLNKTELLVEQEALAECSTDPNQYCLRVSHTCRYYIGNQEVFCLDGATAFVVGGIKYATDSNTKVYENTGMACALVELYDKLKFDSNGNVNLQTMSDNDIYTIQKKMWSHQYDGKECNGNKARVPVKDSGVKLSAASNFGFTLNDTLGYYVSSPITVSATKINPQNNNISLSLLTAPSGTIISKSNTEINKVEKVKPNDKIYIMVPVNITQKYTLNLKATASVENYIEIISKFTEYASVGKTSQRVGIPNLKRNFKYHNVSTNFESSISPTSTKFTITKIDYETNRLLDGVPFLLCSEDGNICNINGTTVDGKIVWSGIAPGKYRLYESIPDGYVEDATCRGNSCSGSKKLDENGVARGSSPFIPVKNVKTYNGITYQIYFSVVINQSKKNVTIANYKASCQSMFDSKKISGNVSMSDRIEIYNYFLNQSPSRNYNALLNLNNTTADNACNSYTCNYSSSSNCLSGSISTGFSATNLSCYDEKITYQEGTIAYCQNSLEFQKASELGSLGTKNNPFTGAIGRMIIKSSSGLATNGTITKKCYIVNSLSSLNLKSLFNSPSSLLGAVKLNYLNKNTINNRATFKDWTEFSGESELKVYKSDFKYNFNEVKLLLDDNPNFCTSGSCRNIGYGVVSSYADKINELKEMGFSFKFKLPSDNNKNNYEGGITASGTCYYRLGDGLVFRDELNLEFRVIDTKNPFPGINGLGRNTKDNWCGVNASGNKDCSNTNNVVSDVILNSKNSYSTQAKYVIELTPSDIKNIRKYNKTNSYKDQKYYYMYGSSLSKYYDFEECKNANGGNDCIIKSEFLSSLGNKLTINNG